MELCGTEEYQALDTQIILVGWIVGFGLFMGFVNSKKNAEHCQPQSLKANCSFKSAVGVKLGFF